MAAPFGNEFYRMRINTGAPRKFETPEDLAEAFNKYFEYIEASPLKEAVLMKVKIGQDEKVKVYNRPLPRAMTIQGFCAHAGFASTALYEYEKQDGYREIVARAKEIMFSQKLEGAAAGLFNPSIIARELGLAEKSEQRIVQEQPLFDDSDED